MCDDRLISGIIGDNDLQPGDNMMSKGGMVILDSVVVDAFTALYRQGDVYTLDSENPLTGKRTLRNFTQDAMAVLRNIDF